MTAATTTYTIKTLADFLKVPEGRRKICLEEFNTWLRLADFLDETAAEVVWLDTDTFTWIDDGKCNIYPRIKIEQ